MSCEGRSEVRTYCGLQELQFRPWVFLLSIAGSIALQMLVLFGFGVYRVGRDRGKVGEGEEEKDTKRGEREGETAPGGPWKWATTTTWRPKVRKRAPISDSEDCCETDHSNGPR